jgi:Cu/Ag efflux pump CusA
MMRWIVGSSLKARRAVVAVAVVIMVFGVWTLRRAEVDVLPEFAPVTVDVQTEALGLSAEEVEQLITVPLEQDLLDGVAWLDHIESKSVPGLSWVHMTFEKGTDLYRARQVVQERISQAAGLPQVSRPPQMLQPQSSAARTAIIALSSKQLSPLQIGVLARWTIRPRLLAVPGVSNVAIWGQRERQLQVQVDPAKLRDKQVTLEQVISSTGNALWVSPLTFLEASSPGTGGFIDTPSQRLGIQHNLPIIAPADLAAITIDDSKGLTLGDVATVVEDHQPLIGDAVLTGKDATPDSFLLVVDKLPYTNTAEVQKGVNEALDELAPGLKGLDMDASIFRPAAYTDKAVDNLTRSAFVGGILLVVALFLLLYSWRAALTALVAVALSFVIASLVIDAFASSFNSVLVAGLALVLALVIDDAVASVDRAAVRWRGTAHDADASRPTGAGTLLTATLETGRSALWATVMFALALLPLFLINGLAGDSFYPPMAGAALVAVVASLLVAITVTPALGLLLSRKEPLRRESPVARGIKHVYAKAFAPIVRTPVPAFVAMGVLVIGAAFVVPTFDKALLPNLKDTNLLVKWDGPNGTSLPEMDRITSRAATELRTIPGVKDVGAQVGQASLGDAPVGSDSAEMWVSVDPSANYDRVVKDVKAVVAGYPGFHHEVTTYSKNRLTDVLSPTKDEITVRVFGNDNLDTLQQTAEKVRQAVAGADGVASAHLAAPPTEPTMEVEVDLAKAKDLGIKPGDVRRAAATLLSGLRVGNLFEDQKVFDVVVWSTPQSRSSLSGVQDLLIDTPDGGHVRLGDVATVRVRATPPVIDHRDISRFVDVTASVHGRNVGKVADRVTEQLKAVDYPVEYHAELLSDYSHEHGAQRRMLGFALAAAVGIFLLLQAAFRSWRIGSMAFASLVVALTGGVLAAWIDGGPATLATVAGLLAVLGLTLRQSVALLDRYRRLRTEEGLPLGVDLVARGSRERVTPIVISTVAVVAALLPVIVFGSIAGQEILHPMAVIVVGGLITSAVANLFVLPALYLRFAPRREPEPLDFDEDVHEAEPELATAGVAAS